MLLFHYVYYLLVENKGFMLQNLILSLFLRWGMGGLPGMGGMPGMPDMVGMPGGGGKM